MRLFFVAVCAVLLLTAACTSGDETGSSPATTGATETTTGQPTTLLSPTSAPSAEMDAAAVVAALQDAGLSIVETQVYTAETDPNEQLGRPHGYTSKANFADSRLERQEFEGNLSLDSGGSVEAFDNESDAGERFDFLDAVARGILGEYHYLRGVVILRVSKSFTPDEAAEYESAFLAIVP